MAEEKRELSVERILRLVGEALVFNTPFADVLIEAIKEDVVIEFDPRSSFAGSVKVICVDAFRQPKMYCTAIIDPYGMKDLITYPTQESPDKALAEEQDRNARAYGWEVGQGAPLVDNMQTSPGNPFLDPDWKRKVVVTFLSEAAKAKPATDDI